VQLGITFNVYGDTAGTERPSRSISSPRIVRSEEWEWIERGLKQRIHALNQFINDIHRRARREAFAGRIQAGEPTLPVDDVPDGPIVDALLDEIRRQRDRRLVQGRVSRSTTK
jgi:hypothetical protein